MTGSPFIALVVFLVVQNILLPAVGLAGTSAPEDAVQALNSDNWHDRQEAIVQLAEFPAAAEVQEALVERLADVDSRVRRVAAEAVGKALVRSPAAVKGLVKLLDDADPLVREAAAAALGRLGRDSRKAIPDLLEALDDMDPHVREAAVQSVGEIGQLRRWDIKEVTGKLLDKDSGVRMAAAEALGGLGSAAGPALVAAFADSRQEVRHAAAHALGGMGKAALPHLLEAFHSGNPTVLEAAMEAAKVMGPVAIRPLTALLADDNEALLARQQAALALGRIGANDAGVIRLLVTYLGDDNPDLRLAAARGMQHLDHVPADCIPVLIRLLQDVNGDLLLRKYAARILGRAGVDHPEAVAALMESLRDPEPALHDAAVEALDGVVQAGISPAALSSQVESLIQRLENGAPDSRVQAVRELSDLGPAAAPAVGALLGLVQSGGAADPLREEAARALGLIGPSARSAVPGLIAAMEAAGPAQRGTFLLAIQRIGPPQQNLMPRLMFLSGSDEIETREAAALEMRRFAQDRLDSWRPWLRSTRASVLRLWAARHPALYNLAKVPEYARPANADENPEVSLFHILGGVVAIRETVQLQQLQAAARTAEESRTIPIDRIEGVQVEALDFRKMLAEEEFTDVPMPLADMAPMDRLMVYFAKPASIVQFFGKGSGFAARLSSFLTLAPMDYNLSERYLNGLGLSDPQVLAMLASADVKDVLVLLPDLFIVDGTDITCVIRCMRPDLAQLLLDRVGIGPLAGPQPLEHRSGGESTSWWAMRDNLVLISTSRDELQRVLDLQAKNGRGSLGQSDELRYMLRRLPILDETHAYLYLSDEFLRRMVGPAVKIGQYRRMQARNDLQILTAMALLYKLDGHPGSPDLDTLARLGYLPPQLVRQDYTLGPDLLARSDTYGPASAMFPLSRQPVDRVTATEEKAYRAYMERYTSFWREFFDPIALRVDEPAPQTVDVTTFILPLIDSSLYEELRDILPRSGPEVGFQVPAIEPKPVLITSLNLSDAMRIGLTRKFAEAFTDFTSVSPEMLDSLGPALHFAVHDSNPIVALGSGDLMRAAGKELGGGADELFGIPTLLSLVTQPCQILVEVQDPERVVAFLDEASLSKTKKGVPGELFKEQGREKWIYHLNLFELVRISVGIELKNGYLVISNMPWSQRNSIRGSEPADFDGAQLSLNLDALREHLPALHMATMSDYSSQAMEGMACLYPLLASGHAASVAQALQRHADLFGFTPVHPDGGEWIWREGTLSSSLFGTLEKPLQPVFDPANHAFGLVRGVDQISVNMQMEQEGLRARVRWVLTPP